MADNERGAIDESNHRVLSATDDRSSGEVPGWGIVRERSSFLKRSGEEMDLTTQCEYCGAWLDKAEDCQSLHERLVGYDFNPDNAVPHATHFLQVTCFMVQHDRFSDEALGWARDMLRLHLDGHVDARELRRYVTSRLAGAAAGSRAWRFQRAPGARPLPRIAWKVTIADVARRMRQGDAYDQVVAHWARATLEQMTPLLMR